MRVFMLGWEFPPYISGGLGTACYGLTRAMDQLGVEVIFCLPKKVEDRYTNHVRLVSPASLSSQPIEMTDELNHTTFHTIESILKPYSTPELYQKQIEEILRSKKLMLGEKYDVADMGSIDYSGDLHGEAHRYAALAARIASREDFDVIHAHDWMTFPAGYAVACVTGKPLVVHIHSTEFDRSGENVNQMVYDIERMGVHVADRVVAVSQFTRNILIERYGVDAHKIEVVHNGVERNGKLRQVPESLQIARDEKIVLFLGRITMQKGPEYFLQAAKRVLDVMDNVKFVMAGSGDLMYRAIEMAAELGIGNKVLFTGFLRGEDVQKIYQMADLFVMPSVSEPFGLVPLEALDNDVPVLISRQSGVSEVLTHVLKVDFWDIQEMANKVVAVLKYPPLSMTLRSHGNYEVRKLSWQDAAQKCLRTYCRVLADRAKACTV